MHSRTTYNIAMPIHESDPSMRAERIGTGKNARVYAVGGKVVKISRSSFSPRRANRHLLKARDQFSMIQDYLGGSVVDTHYALDRLTGERRLRLVTTQPRVDGIPLNKAHEFDAVALARIFGTALVMYEQKGQIPDLAAIEKGRFNPMRDDNIVIKPDGTPILVDANYGRLQAAPGTKIVWSYLIARGVKKALSKL